MITEITHNADTAPARGTVFFDADCSLCRRLVARHGPVFEPLARAVCGFLAVFWTIRLIAAVFVFDVRPYLTHRLWKLGYHMTNVVIALVPLIYGLAAWKGGTS